MATVREIEAKLYGWAPHELAESWDNVGLLVGSGEREVKKILVALDITETVAQEALDLGADLIVAHHPVMNCTWHKVQNVLDDNAQGRILTKLLKNDVAAICMHTNLDATEGGVNDCLAEKLGICDTIPLNEEKIGRVGTLSCEKGLEEFLPVVVKSLNCRGLRYRDGGKRVYKVAVGGGACGDFIPQAIALGCDTFVTSDLSYHEFLDTQGLNLIDAGHFPTENVVCGAIKSYLDKHFPDTETVISTLHRDVIQYYM